MKNVKRKYIISTYLREVQEYEYNLIEDKKNNCYISRKKIISIKSPFCTENSGCLINKMYSIIEIVPLDENYCIRLFIDKNKKIILYYFDITLKNDKIIILDEEELNEALEKKYISKKEYNLAQKVKNELVDSLSSKTNKYMKIEFTKYL